MCDKSSLAVVILLLQQLDNAPPGLDRLTRHLHPFVPLIWTRPCLAKTQVPWGHVDDLVKLVNDYRHYS